MNKLKTTKNILISRIYSQQKVNSKKREHPIPTYSFDELRSWLYSQKKFHILFDNWKRLDFQRDYAPSVDRKDDNIGYTMDNIQLMTWRENNAKGHKDHKSGKIKYDQKPVIQISKGGKIVAEFHSTMEASRITGINQSNIRQCCKQNRMTAGGYQWKDKEAS